MRLGPRRLRNACDGDFDNNLAVDGIDFSPTFLTDFVGGFMSLNAMSLPNGTDMTCSGTVDGADFSPSFTGQFVAGLPGPSGLPCAGTAHPCL